MPVLDISARPGEKHVIARRENIYTAWVRATVGASPGTVSNVVIDILLEEKDLIQCMTQQRWMLFVKPNNKNYR